MTKLMEIFGDSRCTIYAKKNSNNKFRVEWEILWEIKQYYRAL